MRVLHILDHSIPHESGYALRTLALLTEQRARGWETFHVTGPKQGPGTGPDEVVAGWNFYRTPLPGSLLDKVPGLSEIEMMGEITYRIEQVVKRVRPHILHAHSPVLNAIPALRVGSRVGTPVVYEVRALWEDAGVDHGTIRDHGLRYRLMRALETWVLKRADAVTTISTAMQQEIAGRGIEESRITVVPNAADPGMFAPGSGPDPEFARRLGLQDALVLGFIGTLHPGEGLETLLRALPQLIRWNDRVTVLLAGTGPQEADLKRLAAELGVKNKVVFAGRIPHYATPAYYDLMTVLVCPRLSTRRTERVTPLKAYEAMARRCLVAASDIGGHREVIRDGETGVLFRPGDPGALADAVTSLLDAPDRWPLMRAAGRRVVEVERNWAASVARYEGVYDQLMRRDRGRPENMVGARG